MDLTKKSVLFHTDFSSICSCSMFRIFSVLRAGQADLWGLGPRASVLIYIARHQIAAMHSLRYHNRITSISKGNERGAPYRTRGEWKVRAPRGQGKAHPEILRSNPDCQPDRAHASTNETTRFRGRTHPPDSDSVLPDYRIRPSID